VSATRAEPRPPPAGRWVRSGDRPARRSLRQPPTWLLGLVVALLAWRVGMSPPGPGLDPSWNGGLAMALKDGLRFGRDVVFSYGPLGFLEGQDVWYGDLAVIAFFYAAALYVASCLGLVWALRRTLSVLPSALLAFVIVAALPLQRPILVAVLACMALLERGRSQRTTIVFAAAGASFGAVQALVKLSTGPVVAVLFLLALIGARARRGQILGFVALLAAELPLLWLLSGQSLAAVPAFLENTAQIVSGYGGAMLSHVDVPAWKVTMATVAAAIVTIALVVASLGGRYRDGRARWAAAALMAVAAFSVFKEGVVRVDAAHLTLYFSTACGLWIAIPWARAHWPRMLAGAVAIGAVVVPVHPPGMPIDLNPIANVRFAADQLRNLASGSRRASLTEAGRIAMKSVYRLDRRTRAAIGAHTVAVEPWEVGVAWAYRLDWSPLPVFQDYSAYTTALDRLNAAAVASPNGPARILRENEPLVYPEFPTRDLDNRFPGWDPPAEARAVLCHFAPLHTTERWQVLGRVANRCGQSHLIRSMIAQPGETVAVPAAAPNEVVFVRIQGAGVGGLEKVWGLLLHARVRQAIVNGTDAYRLLPGTATDGLMLRSGARLAESGPFSPIPQARTLELTGTSGPLRLDFFGMPIASVAGAHNGHISR
jgi:hypothetical protein